MSKNIYEDNAVVKLLDNSGLTYDQKMAAYDAILAAVFHGIEKMSEVTHQNLNERLK